MQMLGIIVATIVTLSLGAAAHAETRGYYDADRVRQESAEGQRIAGELSNDFATKQREVAAAQEAVAKAKPNERAALQQKAARLGEMDTKDLAQHRRDAYGAMRKHLGAIVTRLKAEHRLAEVLPVLPPDAPEKLDFTDEIIRRLDASDPQATADENERLKAEVAQWKAKAEAKTEPVNLGLQAKRPPQ